MGLDTSGAEGKLLLTVLGSVAESERDIILARQRQGIAKAKQDGRYKGIKPTTRAKSEEIRAMANEGVRKTETALRLVVGLRPEFRVLGDVKAT